MKRVIRLITVLLILSVLCSCGRTPENNAVKIDGRQLSVSFLDVGQADCILVMVNDSSMLIDAGNNEDGEKVTAYLKSKGIGKLDFAVGTHPHSDHIGGMDTVLKNIKADNVILPEKITDTKTFEDVLDAISSGGMSITPAKAGDEYALSDAVFTILSPGKDYSDNLNNWSVVIRLTYKNDSFIFMGDAETSVEQDLLSSGYRLDSTVIKVGHHGSDTSSSENFLRAVNPSVAVIQCGKDNSYGHPHQQTIDGLESVGAQIFRTDICGTIVAVSNGDGVSIECEKDGQTESLTSIISGGEKPTQKTEYVINEGTMKFHLPQCASVSKINDRNKREFFGERQELISMGYSPCGACKP